MRDQQIVYGTHPLELMSFFRRDVTAAFYIRSEQEAVDRFLKWASDQNKTLPTFDLDNITLHCAHSRLRRQLAPLHADAPEVCDGFIDDMCRLLKVYADITGLDRFEVNLRHHKAGAATDDDTKYFHYDGNTCTVRMVTAYQGKGTEYLTPCAKYMPWRHANDLKSGQYDIQDINRAQPGTSILLKGEGYPVQNKRQHLLYHRAPYISSDEQDRYVFVIDSHMSADTHALQTTHKRWEPFFSRSRRGGPS